MTYLIFQSNISVENNKIKSWAPKRNPKTNITRYWWENVSKIKKGDVIYFISNKYLYAKAIALVDAVEIDYLEYFGEYHNNDSWSEDGYGVISEILEKYIYKQISIITEMKNCHYQIDQDEKKHFPFCIRTKSFCAIQGGYCFEIYDKLVAFIERCIDNNTISISLAESYHYQSILDKKHSNHYGTSEIGNKMKKKGMKGEKKSKRFFEKKGFSVEHVAEEENEPADLVISNQKNQYKIEIKNITAETVEKSFHITDAQLRNLYLQNTYLCLYYGISKKIVFLLSPKKQKSFIKKIIDNFDTIRKNVNTKYEGHYYVNDISILITTSMIMENFIDISNAALDEIESYLRLKK